MIDLKSILIDADIVFNETKTHFILKECPNCGGRDKLWVFKKNHLWQCFKCKGENSDTRSGNLWKFLTKVVGMDNFQVRTLLKDGEDVQYTPQELSNTENVIVTKNCYNDENKKLVHYDLPSNFFPLDCSPENVKKFPDAYKYLISRKVISSQQIRSFRLRYDPARKRLIFPTYIEKDFCVGYQGRDITNRWKSLHPKCPNYKCSLFSHTYFIGERKAPEKCPECGSAIELGFYPKSVNSRDFHKTEFFFNQQNVDWSKPVVLVEGPFDSINTPNSMALLGKFLSDTQFYMLKERVKNIILYLDGDESGTASIKDIYNKLALFIDNIAVCLLQDGEDPGSYSLEDNTLKLQHLLTYNEWAVQKNVLCL